LAKLARYQENRNDATIQVTAANTFPTVAIANARRGDPGGAGRARRDPGRLMFQITGAFAEFQPALLSPARTRRLIMQQLGH
jgi:hypothetical protein